jgi:hypothetical protein
MGRGVDRGVDLPGGMRAPRGEKFWQSSSRDGRLKCVDIEGMRWSRVDGGVVKVHRRPTEGCVGNWATAGLGSS